VYLKEFDLLKEFPQLRADLRNEQLFPPCSIKSCTTWIGPAHARTGLHCDLLDNLAVVIGGRKRFYLARSGAVERLRKASPKYDAWARLSQVTAEELAAGYDRTGDLQFEANRSFGHSALRRCQPGRGALRPEELRGAPPSDRSGERGWWGAVFR
jgi:hypothetical protein